MNRNLIVALLGTIVFVQSLVIAASQRQAQRARLQTEQALRVAEEWKSVSERWEAAEKATMKVLRTCAGADAP